MLKSIHLLAAAGIVLCGQTLASSLDCNQNSIMCFNFSGANTNHYVQIKTDYFVSPPFCFGRNLQSNIGLENNDLEVATALNMIMPGNNHLEFIQCDDRYCRHPISVGKYVFDLNQNPETLSYNVTPPHFTFHFEEYGKTCELPFSFKTAL